ncbi:KinB-signaling pathway activation protein [Paenibacillus sp.]|uniref:KinB-signaling pathway activation protein n=1 Tax=Paenibacillus sp. TaxID=58172 RepID=UPI002811C937|nr:KinB-signaling pathway activation protein [Paenibacillus sp.]
MNLGKWISLFLSTLGIGIGAALVVGVFVFMINPEVTPSTMGVEGILFNLIQTVTVGALLGAFSHMGFFAYLTVNLFAQGIFKNKLMWTYVQVFFIVVVSGYAAMLRVPEGESMLPYFVLPALVVIGGYLVARRKAAETNPKSFVPTLFFMTAVTLLEAVPALQQFNAYGTAMMVLPLFLCNAWQILRLHKILAPARAGEPAGRAS